VCTCLFNNAVSNLTYDITVSNTEPNQQFKPLDHDFEEKSFMSFGALLGHFGVCFFRKFPSYRTEINSTLPSSVRSYGNTIIKPEFYFTVGYCRDTCLPGCRPNRGPRMLKCQQAARILKRHILEPPAGGGYGLEGREGIM
jgi:hypothetical protein